MKNLLVKLGEGEYALVVRGRYGEEPKVAFHAHSDRREKQRAEAVTLAAGAVEWALESGMEIAFTERGPRVRG